MPSWLRFPTRTEWLLVTAICAAVNMPWAIQPYRHLNQVALGFCIGSAIGQIVIAMLSSRRKKSSSPSQQPTSGTFPNPSPSAYLTGGIISWNPFLNASNPPSPSPSEKLSPSKFPLEKRSVPVVGFRSWRVSEAFKLGVGATSQIGAMNDSYGAWQPGVNVAKCHARVYGTSSSLASSLYGYPAGTPATHAHYGTAPDPICTCGFYVLTDLDQVPYRWIRSRFSEPDSKDTFGVVGAVVGWGRVIQHGDEGWRAEKVQVIALLDCKLSDEHLAQTQRIAAVYGVPVVGRTALELLAKEYGEAFA